MSTAHQLASVIVAAGSSRRMGFDKLTAPLAGRPLLAHTLAAFQTCPEVGAVVLVCAEERVGDFERLAADYSIAARVVPGGRERRDSVWKGLEALASASPEFVAIHDGARPLITAEAISSCYQMAREFGAAACAEPETDTVHRVNANLCPIENVPRQSLWRMQTPQIFSFPAMFRILSEEPANDAPATDEVMAWIQSGATARVFETPDWNFKVTHPRDLPWADSILRARSL